MPGYDVFLSHNTHDQAAIEVLAHRLMDEAGLTPFLDRWHLVPGQPWQEAIEAALDACQTVAVFLGPSGIGAWENEEMRSAIEERVRDRSRRVIPVLLPGAPDPREKRLPRFLRRTIWVDFRGGLDDEAAFRRLLAGIRGVAPGPDTGGAVQPVTLQRMSAPGRPLTRYHDFELQVDDPHAGQYPVRAVASPAGEGEATFKMPFAADELTTLLARLEKDDTDAAFLADVGERLFTALFSGDVHARYAESVGRAGSEEGLRLRLRLDPPELQALPWELLRDPEKREALALSKRVLIVRYLPVPRPAPPIAVQPPLRILAATASPSNCMPLDVEGEVLAIAESLRPLGSRVQVMPLPHASASTLRQHLIDIDPHVLHFAGHGDFDGREGALLLEDWAGRAERLPGTVLATLLKGTNVRLAVLNACLSAADAAGSQRRAAMLGVGPALVDVGLGAVVGMQFSLPDASGVALAHDFYAMLARGLPVDVSLSRAREALLLAAGCDSRDWAAPVLFLRAPDGVLFVS
ncbi:MAG: CHAT domain-containing protein [Chloroflexota bacterium]